MFFEYLPIGHRSFDELLSLFMLRMPDDHDYYDFIATNMLSSNRDFTLGIYEELNINRKRAIITGIGCLSNNDIVLEQFLINKLSESKLSESDNRILVSVINSLSYFENIDCKKIESFLNKDVEIDVRCAAIRFFAKQKGMGFKSELVRLLTDKNPKIKENALDEIEDLGYHGFLADIKLCLKDPNFETREIAKEIIDRWESDS